MIAKKRLHTRLRFNMLTTKIWSGILFWVGIALMATSFILIFRFMMNDPKPNIEYLTDLGYWKQTLLFPVGVLFAIMAEKLEKKKEDK